VKNGSHRPRITDDEALALRRLAGQLAIVILERRKRAYAEAGVDPRIRERPGGTLTVRCKINEP